MPGIFDTILPWFSGGNIYKPSLLNRIHQQYDFYGTYDLYLGYAEQDENEATNFKTINPVETIDPFLVMRYSPYKQPQVDLLSEAIARVDFIDRYQEWDDRLVLVADWDLALGYPTLTLTLSREVPFSFRVSLVFRISALYMFDRGSSTIFGYDRVHESNKESPSGSWDLPVPAFTFPANTTQIRVGENIRNNYDGTQIFRREYPVPYPYIWYDFYEYVFINDNDLLPESITYSTGRQGSRWQ